MMTQKEFIVACRKNDNEPVCPFCGNAMDYVDTGSYEDDTYGCQVCQKEITVVYRTVISGYDYYEEV